jgi:hypothetical protein
MSRAATESAAGPGEVPGIGESKLKAGPDNEEAAAIEPEGRTDAEGVRMGLSVVGANSTGRGAGAVAWREASAATGTAAAIEPPPVMRGTAAAIGDAMADPGSAGRAASAGGAAASNLAPQPRQNL